MTTFRYTITAEDAGDEIQHFLRFKQGISRKVVISLKHLPEGILRNGQHARTVDLLREGDLLEINLPEQDRSCRPVKSMCRGCTGTGMLLYLTSPPGCRCINRVDTFSGRWQAFMPPCAKRRGPPAPSGR